MMLRLAVALLLAPVAAEAVECRDTSFEGASYTVCEVAAGEDLRLFHSGPDGTFGSFRNVDEALGAEGKALGFAMNAGMYHRDLAPVGLYVEDGVEVSKLVTNDGPGNFGMLPNGVFCIGEAGFSITDSRDFAAAPKACRFATQSGPMMVKQGVLHPRFIPGGDSKYIRNGVGVSADGQRAVFAISEDSVNFDTFGRLFRDELALPDALYFDGKISRLYAPALRRSDMGMPMGPIVGLVVPKP